MIDENKLFTALTNIISSPRTTKLLKSLILPNGHGEYLLFGIYVIRKERDCYSVHIGNEQINTFSDLKTAVTWSTMDHRNLIMESNKVNMLDKQINSSEFNIELYKKMYKKSKDVDMKAIYLNKLQTNTIKKKELTYELDLHIKKMQKWQQSKFAEQTTK
jgi:hypothetical protein